jgi:hypothetical protein
VAASAPLASTVILDGALLDRAVIEELVDSGPIRLG